MNITLLAASAGLSSLLQSPYFYGAMGVFILAVAVVAVRSYKRVKWIKFWPPGIEFYPPAQSAAPPPPAIDMDKFGDAVRKILEEARRVPTNSPTAPAKTKLEEAKGQLEQNNLRRAKELFDEILQKKPKNIEALFGLGQLYERAGGAPRINSAMETYWKVIRLNPRHESARKCIENHMRQVRAQQLVAELRQRDRDANTIYLADFPLEAAELARYLTALSNAEGGEILIGFDPVTREPSDYKVGPLDADVLDEAWRNHTNHLCQIEELNGPRSTCKVILVYPGDKKPYRVLLGRKSEHWVLDGKGGVRQAIPPAKIQG